MYKRVVEKKGKNLDGIKRQSQYHKLRNLFFQGKFSSRISNCGDQEFGEMPGDAEQLA